MRTLYICSLGGSSIVTSLLGLLRDINGRSILRGRDRFFEGIAEGGSFGRCISGLVLVSSGTFAGTTTDNGVRRLPRTIVGNIGDSLRGLRTVSGVASTSVCRSIRDRDLHNILGALPR